MSIKDIPTKESFAKLMEESKTKLVVVDFFAEWCGPCKMIAPKIKAFAEQYPEVVFAKVDVDDNDYTDDAHGDQQYTQKHTNEVAALQGIEAMPTFILYKGGEKVETLKGANAEQLEALIKKNQ